MNNPSQQVSVYNQPPPAKQLIVMIQLTGGPVQPITMEAEKAKELVADYLSGRMKLSSQTMIGETDTDLPWAVRADAIIGMRLIDPEEVEKMQRQQMQQQQVGWSPNPGTLRRIDSGAMLGGRMG